MAPHVHVQGLGVTSPEAGVRQLPGRAGHQEDSLKSQVVALLRQELVERDVGVHGPHVLPQGRSGGLRLWKTSGSVRGG